jgi:hypothetical protein
MTARLEMTRKDDQDRPGEGEPPEAEQSKPGFDAKAWKRTYQRLYMKRLRERERRLLAEGKAAYAEMSAEERKAVDEALIADLRAAMAKGGRDGQG